MSHHINIDSISEEIFLVRNMRLSSDEFYKKRLALYNSGVENNDGIYVKTKDMQDRLLPFCMGGNEP